MRLLLIPAPGIFLLALLMLCNSTTLLGPCLMARQYRMEAEMKTGVDRAALEGKALAAERECLEQNERMIEMHRTMKQFDAR